MLNLNPKQIQLAIYAVVAAVSISVLFSIISYLTRDKAEEIRQERYQEAVEQVATLSGSIESHQKQIDDLQIQKAKAEKCMEANSHTGVLVNCNGDHSLIPEAHGMSEVTGVIKMDTSTSKVIEVPKATPKVDNSSNSPNSQIIWLTNKDGQSKSRDELQGNTFEEISLAHGIPIEYWYASEKKWKIKKEVALCIAWADSGLGKHLKTKNNIGNVGNNDRGNRVHISTLEKGVDAIFQTLNNKHLSYKQSIGSLSPGGGGTRPFYATSPDNWDKNTRNCLGVIHGMQITKDFKIRL